MRIQFPYHPEYGATNELRTRVVEFALKTGLSNQKVAELFNVGRTSVGTWVRDAIITEDGK